MKKTIRFIISITASASVLINHALCTQTNNCGKISDYTFTEDDCKVVVANRDAEKKLALTFDDGPSEKYTSKILDILSRNNVKATFFIIGSNAEKNPELVKRIISEGHEIGNHTYSHPQLKKISPEELNLEINKTQKIIKGITGITPTLFRPPGGYLNNTIMEIITSNNCIPVLWSWRQDTMDWKNPPVDTVVNTVLSNVKDGDIILFHDYIYGESPTPEALNRIIPELLNKGYNFLTVTELINTKNQPATQTS